MAQAELRPRLPARIGGRVVDSLANLGSQLTFMAKSLADVIPASRHLHEISRLVSEITLGSGALIVGAGTAGVIFFMSFFTGTQVGLEGFKGLQLIGAEAFTGFVSAFANTREITPLIAGVTLAAQVGCGFTAELGAMRVNEEIDALEVMAVRPVPYLVSTRIIAALVAVLPLYLIALFASYLATSIIVTNVLGLSAGT
ncbi:MAG: MlaE family ABC transporter permease, partial [Actinomycetota bacterium]